MEAFHLLSRGGAKFDKKRFSKDVQLFHAKSSSSSSDSKVSAEKTLDGLKTGELPVELDFFKYAPASGSGSGGAGAGLKAKSEAAAKEQDDQREVADRPAPSSPIGKKRKRDSGKGPAPVPTPVPTPVIVRHKIATTGSNVPPPIERFSDLSDRYRIPPLLLKNLSEHGYTTPTGIQTQGIPILLESRDLAAISPTGTGKTLSYLFPIFAHLSVPSSSRAAATTSTGAGVRALILSPTRELAGQIFNESLKLAQERKWRIVLYSKATGATLAQKEVRDKIDIIISTPLRLVSALKQGTIELENVRHMVLDEADRLLEQGFLPQIEEIIGACTHPNLRKAVFSATLPAGVESVAKSFLFDPIRVVVGLKDAAAESIKQSLVYVGSESGKLSTLRQLLASSPPLPLLVFVQSRERAAELHQELLYDGVAVDVLHAEMTAKQREESVSRMRQGLTWVMVCTEVMARGMDFGGLRGVLNYDFPQSVQSYIHRIGRTGRAGREGDAITYFTDADAPYLKSIANVVHSSGWPVSSWMLALPKPSKMKRRVLKKMPVERKDIGVVAGRGVGKGDAVRRRDMVRASKRRKASGDVPGGGERGKDAKRRRSEGEK